MKKNQLAKMFTAIALSALVACSKKDEMDPIVRPNPTNPTNPGNGQSTTTFTVKIKTKITIGDVMYDSIPSVVTIKSIDSFNISQESTVTLRPGVNEIPLLNRMKNFEFKLSQWGVDDQVSLTKSEAQQSEIIFIGGSIAARKLTAEATYTLINGSYQPSTQSIYAYNSNGKLSQVDFWQKKPQSSSFVRTHVDKFEYSNGMVENIRRFNEQLTEVGNTNFMYDASGRISHILQNSYGQQTSAVVSYTPENNIEHVDLEYIFDNGQSMVYNMIFLKENKLSDVAYSSTGAGESGIYEYDLSVNPYRHMNWPDLYLSNSSKNNVIKEQKSYGGVIPTAIPYKFEYTYDAFGYPTELIKSYKSGTTGQHLYITKTIYSY